MNGHREAEAHSNKKYSDIVPCGECRTALNISGDPPGYT